MPWNCFLSADRRDRREKHPTNGLRGLPSRIWVWGWGHWAPRMWVSRTDLPTPTRAKQESRRASDHNCSDGVKRRSRPPNPPRWAPKQEGLATATAQTASKDAPAHQNHLAGFQSKKGQATATAQTASKDTPAHQIEVAGPQSEKGKRPQLLRRRQKTPPAATSRSLGPKARRASDRNCSDGAQNQFPPHKARKRRSHQL